MANELKEFNDIVKKCKILLLDIEGTTTSISFVKDKLFPYAEENVKTFLENMWENEDVKEAVNALRKQALEDQEKSVDGVIAISAEDASREDQIESLVKNVKWQMASDRKVGALKELQGLIWKQGYDSGAIKGHVYEDVMPALEQWRSVDSQKVYIYSSGSVQAQKLLFGQSLAGDILKFINGHFDTAVGAKQESSSYKAIIEKIGCAADEVLFLTDIVKEAEAARNVGLYAAIVSRDGNSPLPEETWKTFPVIKTFSQLTVSNKRKTEPQEEQPAKVAKTDIKDDQKSGTESSETITENQNVETVKQSDTKMEVDDSDLKDNKVEQEKTERIDNQTDSKSINTPLCNTEPIKVLVNEDQEINESKMETENNGTTITAYKNKIESKDITDIEATKETIDVPKDQAEVKEDNGPVAEETPPVVITEIVEINNEKEVLADVADIIEGLDPVIEEPAVTAEIEDLQNVGEELEKECDEILSKLNDVTNLENMNVKPLLNPIIEEPMDVESELPSDVVDKVMEVEVEMKESKVEQSIGSEKTKDIKEEAENSEVSMSDTTTSVKDSAEKPDTTKEALEETNVVKDNVQSELIKNVQNDKNNEKKTESKDTDTQTTIGKETQSDITEPEKLQVKETQKLELENEDKSKSSVETAKDEVIKEITTDKIVESSEANKSEANEPTVENKSEVQVNGDATNGTPETLTQNGIEKDDEIKARLSAENGKELNGSNGTNDEQGQSEKKIEEVSDIKVKTLAKEDPCPDPTEQVAEA